ncbi:MAG: hypothetical protein VB876_02915, partial [Pirellulales bacterium]
MSAIREAAVTRRRFLEASIPVVAVSAVVPATVPPHVLGKETPSGKITLGFIGAGIHGLGWNLRGFLKFADAKVLAVCDVMASRRDTARKVVNQHYR